MNFIIPRQCGKTISFNEFHNYYTKFLSDYGRKLLESPVISTKYKTAILDKFLDIEINNIQSWVQ